MHNDIQYILEFYISLLSMKLQLQTRSASSASWFRNPETEVPIYILFPFSIITRPAL